MIKRLMPNGVSYFEGGISKVGKGKTPGRLADRLPRELSSKVGTPPTPVDINRIVRRTTASDK